MAVSSNLFRPSISLYQCYINSFQCFNRTNLPTGISWDKTSFAGKCFFWDQFRKYWEALKEAQKWIGGTVSAAIGFLPGIGNAKSFAEFGLGYDYLADKPVTGWDRLFAGIGAIPVVGNLVRGTRYAVQIARVVKAAD